MYDELTNKEVMQMIKVSLDQIRLLGGDLNRLLHRLRCEEQSLADTERQMRQLRPMEDVAEELRQKQRQLHETLYRLEKAIRLLEEITWDYRETERRNVIGAQIRGVRLFVPIAIPLDSVDVSDIPLIERGG